MRPWTIHDKVLTYSAEDSFPYTQSTSKYPDCQEVHIQYSFPYSFRVHAGEVSVRGSPSFLNTSGQKPPSGQVYPASHESKPQAGGSRFLRPAGSKPRAQARHRK